MHLFGLSADLAPILDLANPHHIAVIEDAAQAIGARYRGTRVGGLGAAGCFSFFPSKNLGGIGDGGLITANDPALAQSIRLLREHGSARKYHYETLGFNSRLDEIQAAVLRVKLRHLDRWTVERRAKATRYRELFAERGLEARVRLPLNRPDLSTCTISSSSAVPGAMSCGAFSPGAEFPTEIYYPAPLHLQPAFAYLGYRLGSYPRPKPRAAEVLASTPLSRVARRAADYGRGCDCRLRDLALRSLSEYLTAPVSQW